MASGIGPQTALDALQIPIVKALPGVGQNLQVCLIHRDSDLRGASNESTPLGPTFLRRIIQSKRDHKRADIYQSKLPRPGHRQLSKQSDWPLD